MSEKDKITCLSDISQAVKVTGSSLFQNTYFIFPAFGISRLASHLFPESNVSESSLPYLSVVAISCAELTDALLD